MADDKPNDQLVREVARSILNMDAANPERFLKETMKMQKLSLELELARHQAEKWEGTREERKSEFDSRRSIKSTTKVPAAVTPLDDPAIVEVISEATRGVVMQLGLEVGALSGQVNDMVAFIPAAINMMKNKIEKAEEENEKVKNALEEQMEKVERLEKRMKKVESLEKGMEKVESLHKKMEKVERLEKRRVEMNVKAQTLARTLSFDLLA
ncbi:hypothetical protein KCV07_g9853, partial [Aureobasidium melanogenum]